MTSTAGQHPAIENPNRPASDFSDCVKSEGEVILRVWGFLADRFDKLYYIVVALFSVDYLENEAAPFATRSTIMKNILTLALAVTALAFFGSDNASAQGYNNGYFFGAGINQSFRGGGSQFTAPPYFAQFPPVYYNGIVRRPYGISPYAAPAGVAPVELHYIPEDIAPIKVINPYMNNVNPSSTPTMKTEAKDDSTINKATWTRNPYIRPLNLEDEFASILIK